MELSAADASNPDKAKSANSVSLILVYIRLPSASGAALPPTTMTGPGDEGTAQIPPPPTPAFTDPISTRASQRKPQSLSCHQGSPLAPHCTFSEA